MGWGKLSRSTGIGTAICRSLASLGADIFFTHWHAFDETEGNGGEKEWIFPSEAYPYLDTRWGDSANEGAFCIGIANSNALSPNVKYWWVIQGPVPVYINNSVFPDHYIPNEGGAKISFQRSYNYVSATLTGLGHPSNGHDTWSVFQEEYERLIQPLKFRDYKVPSRKEFNITNNELYITRSKL